MPTTSNDGAKTILICEDEESLRELVRLALGPSYHYAEATDGIESARARAQAPARPRDSRPHAAPQERRRGARGPSQRSQHAGYSGRRDHGLDARPAGRRRRRRRSFRSQAVRPGRAADSRGRAPAGTVSGIASARVGTADAAPAARRPRGRLASMPLATRMIIASVVLAVLVGLVLLGLLLAISSLRDATNREVRAKGVVTSAVSVEKLVLDLQTGVRGFVLTGDERTLAPYRSARRELPDDLAALERLSADDPQQAERARKLRNEIDALHRLVHATRDRHRTREPGGSRLRRRERRGPAARHEHPQPFQRVHHGREHSRGRQRPRCVGARRPGDRPRRARHPVVRGAHLRLRRAARALDRTAHSRRRGRERAGSRAASTRCGWAKAAPARSAS